MAGGLGGDGPPVEAGDALFGCTGISVLPLGHPWDPRVMAFRPYTTKCNTARYSMFLLFVAVSESRHEVAL